MNRNAQKFAPQKSGMTHAAWLAVQSKGVRPNMIHKSCDTYMVPDPQLKGPPLPWIQKPGVTFNIGRNAAKRARKAAGRIVRK